MNLEARMLGADISLDKYFLPLSDSPRLFTKSELENRYWGEAFMGLVAPPPKIQWVLFHSQQRDDLGTSVYDDRVEVAYYDGLGRCTTEIVLEAQKYLQAEGQEGWWEPLINRSEASDLDPCKPVNFRFCQRSDISYQDVAYIHPLTQERVVATMRTRREWQVGGPRARKGSPNECLVEICRLSPSERFPTLLTVKKEDFIEVREFELDIRVWRESTRSYFLPDETMVKAMLNSAGELELTARSSQPHLDPRWPKIVGTPMCLPIS